ncbi:TPA: hypothetical protein ACYEOW_000110 [Raoultella terrigena]
MTAITILIIKNNKYQYFIKNTFKSPRHYPFHHATIPVSNTIFTAVVTDVTHCASPPFSENLRKLPVQLSALPAAMPHEISRCHTLTARLP